MCCANCFYVIFFKLEVASITMLLWGAQGLTWLSTGVDICHFFYPASTPTFLKILSQFSFGNQKKISPPLRPCALGGTDSSVVSETGVAGQWEWSHIFLAPMIAPVWECRPASLAGVTGEESPFLHSMAISWELPCGPFAFIQKGPAYRK